MGYLLRWAGLGAADLVSGAALRLQSGHSQAHIARTIGVHSLTISRELVRNTGARGYRFKQAHDKASQRRKEASDKPRKMTPDLVELVEQKLTQEQWSSWSDQRPSGEGWRRLYQSRPNLSACLERQERRGAAASALGEADPENAVEICGQ
jgi:hypothetical protein